MQINHVNMLKYWRNSLVDTERMSASISDESVEISLDELQSGKINEEIKDNLVEKAKKTRLFDDDEKRIPVLLCTKQLKAKVSHGRRIGKDYSLLWIAAELAPTGQICPMEGGYPWISRALLEPLSGESVDFTLGKLDDLEKFISDIPPEHSCQNWKGLLAYGNEMVKKVIKEIPPDYSQEEKAYIMLDEKAREYSASLRGLYDNIIRTAEKSKNDFPLLNKYLSLDDAPIKPAMSLAETLDQAGKHLGQMTASFSLAQSQREALHCFLSMEKEEFLAVNGPPGTGKTTLLHSVIASMWVDAAYQGSDEPPIIIAVSANNQAVTNIIDSFGKVLHCDNGDLLAERWLPGIKSYGLYFPAKKRLEKAGKHFQVASTLAKFPDDTGFPGEVESKEYIAKAANFFLQKCEQYFGSEISTVDAACSALHRELKRQVYAIQDSVGEKKEIIRRREKLLTEIKEMKNRYKVGAGQDLLNVLNDRLQEIEEQEKYVLKQKEDVDKESTALASEFEQRNCLQKAWQLHRKSEPFWWKIFCFLPSVKKRQQARLFAFKQHHKLEQVPDIEFFISTEVQSILAKKEEKRQKRDRLCEESRQLAEQRKSVSEDREKYRRLLGELEKAKKEIDSLNLDEFLKELDTSARHKAFLLATHYWEARWLAKVVYMRELVENNQIRTGKEKIKMKLRLYAMLTPCMVATLYMLPNVMSSSEKTSDDNRRKFNYLYGFADLLIIDEAGQVSPDLAAPVFALGKKALIVGDRYQIEPVCKITKPVDIGNLARYNIIGRSENDDKSYDELKAKGIAVSSGCAMTVAQRACRFQKYYLNNEPYPERGMFLREHYRCLDIIISYCSELAYAKRLIPNRGSCIPAGGLMPFGYLKVVGRSQRLGGSRCNKKEAEAILKWLLTNKKQLEEVYGQGEKRIFEIVAIVTPFAAQKKLLNDKLRSSYFAGLKGDKEEEIITAGTVHSLQGAERDVVIFSPVYTANDGHPSSFFFNKSKNMLNVAVSRAKNSFLVFGDLEVFLKGDSILPSRLLGKYLFSEPKSDLSGWM